MTPDQIIQLRHLLKTALCPNVTNGCQDGIMPNPYGEMEQCQWCNERKQALAFLPCPTCNDSGRVPTFDQASGLADADPCPDCSDDCVGIETLKKIDKACGDNLSHGT